METVKFSYYSNIPETFTGIAEYPNGTKKWYLNGSPHRENDLPAFEFADGEKQWWINGACHRNNDLPAFIDADGCKIWYLNGKIHRESGPAVEHPDGRKEWWYNGKEYASFTKLQEAHQKRILNPNILSK